MSLSLLWKQILEAVKLFCVVHHCFILTCESEAGLSALKEPPEVHFFSVPFQGAKLPRNRAEPSSLLLWMVQLLLQISWFGKQKEALQGHWECFTCAEDKHKLSDWTIWKGLYNMEFPWCIDRELYCDPFCLTLKEGMNSSVFHWQQRF